MKVLVPLLFAVLAATTTAAFGQGSLTPPGAPAPTMRTLDQVEARTPVAAGTSGVTISQDGSYYLTGDIAVASGSGITVSANNVSLDLNGFSVSSTASTVSGEGISFAGTGDYVVRNGRVRSNTTFNTDTAAFTAAGFSAGVIVNAAAASVRVENLEIGAIGGDGISLNGPTGVVSHCQVTVAAGAGIVNNGGPVDHCAAMQCNGNAVQGSVVSDCTGFSFTGNGIYATNSATNCQGRSNNVNSTTASGIQATAVMNSCGVTSNGGAGINATEVRGSQGNSGAGRGITAMVVADSYGTGGTAGVVASTALNTYGFASAGTGVQASLATNSYGITNGTTNTCYGIDCSAFGTAANCYGSAGSSTAYSFRAKIVNGCALGTGSQALITHNVNSF